MAYQRLSKYRISFHLFKLSEPWKFQMCSFCVNTDEKQFKTGHFFSHFKLNEKMSHIWHNGIPKAFRISNYFSFIQSQWAMKIPDVSILHQYRWNTVQKGHFSIIPNRMEKWVIFDTMAYERLPKYQISFPLFKVNELWKLQMSSFCVSSDEKHSSKQAIFLSFKTEWKMSHFWHNGIPITSQISH